MRKFFLMFRSFLIKAVMLAVTAGLVLWVGWPVPSQDNRGPVSPVSPDLQSKLDLNRASVEDLTHLPGIGPVLAQRIIERRQNNGLYRSVEGLLKVKGIGKTRLNRLRSLILVSTTPRPPQAITGQPGYQPTPDRHPS